MKKLTAMLLSLVMCFSLIAIPAHAASLPDPDSPGIISVGKTPIDPGKGDLDEPEPPAQPNGEKDLPLPRDEIPGE